MLIYLFFFPPYLDKSRFSENVFWNCEEACQQVSLSCGFQLCAQNGNIIRSILAFSTSSRPFITSYRSPEQPGLSSPCQLSQAVWSQPQVAPIRRMVLFLFSSMFEAVMERCSVYGIKCGKTFPSWETAAQTLRRLFHWQRQDSHPMEDVSLKPNPSPISACFHSSTPILLCSMDQTHKLKTHKFIIA